MHGSSSKRRSSSGGGPNLGSIVYENYAQYAASKNGMAAKMISNDYIGGENYHQQSRASTHSLLQNKQSYTNAGNILKNKKQSSKTLIMETKKEHDPTSINIIIMGDQTTAVDEFDKKKRNINTYSSFNKPKRSSPQSPNVVPSPNVVLNPEYLLRTPQPYVQENTVIYKTSSLLNNNPNGMQKNVGHARNDAQPRKGLQMSDSVAEFVNQQQTMIMNQKSKETVTINQFSNAQNEDTSYYAQGMANAAKRYFVSPEIINKSKLFQIDEKQLMGKKNKYFNKGSFGPQQQQKLIQDLLSVDEATHKLVAHQSSSSQENLPLPSNPVLLTNPTNSQQYVNKRLSQYKKGMAGQQPHGGVQAQLNQQLLTININPSSLPEMIKQQKRLQKAAVIGKHIQPNEPETTNIQSGQGQVNNGPASSATGAGRTTSKLHTVVNESRQSQMAKKTSNNGGFQRPNPTLATTEINGQYLVTSISQQNSPNIAGKPPKINNSLEINGLVAITNPSPRANAGKNKGLAPTAVEQQDQAANTWWFLEKKVIEQFKSANAVNKEQQLQDCYMSSSSPPKKHGKKGQIHGGQQQVNVTQNKVNLKGSIDDLDQTIPLIQVLQAPPLDPNSQQQPLSNRKQQQNAVQQQKTSFPEVPKIMMQSNQQTEIVQKYFLSPTDASKNGHGFFKASILNAAERLLDNIPMHSMYPKQNSRYQTDQLKKQQILQNKNSLQQPHQRVSSEVNNITNAITNGVGVTLSGPQQIYSHTHLSNKFQRNTNHVHGQYASATLNDGGSNSRTLYQQQQQQLLQSNNNNSSFGTGEADSYENSRQKLPQLGSGIQMAPQSIGLFGHSQFRGSHGQGVPGKAQQSMLMGGMLQTNNVPPMIIQQTQLYTGSTVNNQFKQVSNNPGATRIVDPNSLVGFLEIQRVTMALPGSTANNQNCNHHKQNDQQFLLSHPTNSVEKIHLQQRPQCCAHLQPHQPQMYQFLVQSPQVSGNAYLLRKQQQNNKFGRGDIDEATAPVEIKQVNQSYLYFTVIPGNNSGLIRDAMLRRSNKWREASSFNDPTCHFRWQPVSYGLKFDQLGSLINPNTHAYTKQLVNHFECHGHLTEKSKLFKNLQDYALTRLRENVFNYIPLTFYVEVDISKTKQFAKAMLPFFNSFYALEDNKKKVVKYYEKVEEFNSLGLAMQQANANTESQPVMAKSMGSLPNLLGSDINNHQTQSNANLIPKPAGPVGSAGAPIECPLEEAFIFKHFYNNRRGLIKQHLKEEKDALDNHKGALKKNFFRYTMPFCHFTGYNLWLLKPTKLNRGRGIHVINNLTQLKALIQRYCEGWSKPNGVFTGNTVQPKAAQRAIEGEIIEQSPDKEGGAEMGTDEEEESPTTQPSSTLPPLTQEETNGSKLNTQPASLQMTQQKPPQQQPQYKIKHNSFILQKYIEKPFLIYQRKFDIRVWVFLNYDSSLYFFPEGYLRTSSSEFAIDPNNPDDQYVHLTNNAIQKYSQSYGVFEDGNQMSYAQFQDYLDSHGFSGYSVKDHTVEVMKSLIMRSMLATRKLLDPQRRRGCFELFGYDFILDEDFNTWLIEVNTNPCIEESSKILKVLIPRMLDDMLKLSVDQYFNDFQPKKRQQQSFDADDQQNHAPQQTYRFPVPGYDDDENMWEFMCKLGDKKSKKEAKTRYVTQAPLPINSKFAFQVKDREFKIKKYLQPTVPTAGGPTTAGVSKNQEKDQLVAAATSSSPQLEGERSASGGITENLAAAGS